MANHGPVYGLDADLKAKQDSKYDSQIEGETRAWVEAVTGEKITDFHTDLKDGVTLCNLVNKIRPGLVKKINKQKTPFMMMENIGFFLKGCAALGVNKVDQFMTVDLYEAKNLGQVIHCIHALGRHVSNSSSYTGPLLGTSEVPRSSSTVTSPVKASNDDAEREQKERAAREAQETKEREEKARQEQEKREQEERERKETEAREAQERADRELAEKQAEEKRAEEERVKLELEKQDQAAREASLKEAQEAKEKEEREERERQERIENEKQEQAAREAQAAKEKEEREVILREAKAREEESERKEKELQAAKEQEELKERIEKVESLATQAVLVTSDQGPISQAQLQALLNRLETLESAKSQIESKLTTLENESKDLKSQLHEQTELNGELTKTVASLNKILEDLK
jgi:chromosome segregation ATPase